MFRIIYTICMHVDVRGRMEEKRGSRGKGRGEENEGKGGGGGGEGESEGEEGERAWEMSW